MIIVPDDLRDLLETLLKKHLDNYYCETVRIIGEYSMKTMLYKSREDLHDLSVICIDE